MKKKILLLLSVIVSISVSAQYSRASLWTGNISAFTAQDAVNGTPKNVVLFIGSSTFTNWSSVQNDFPDSPILNRAFGGSWMSDLIYYFNQIVVPYSPKQVVLYEGDNDLFETKTVDEFFDDVVTMTRLINIYYPSAKILLVSIKPSPSRTSVFEKYKSANALMKSYADKISYIEYADTWTPMLNTDGTPNTSLFGSDMLHMNTSGYAIWKTVLKPYLLTGSITITPTDKLIFTESSNSNYHEYSWSNVTSPSIFVTNKAEKISTDSTYYHNGKTSLKISYKGVSGGDWKACVAAPMWTFFDIGSCKELEFWVYSPASLSGNDLPYIYLESGLNTVSDKVKMSDYIASIPATTWTKVIVPISAWKNISPGFNYTNVKDVFFSQFGVNAQQINLYIDDVTFKATASLSGSSAADILVDFGAATSTTPNNWNNITDTQAANTTLLDKNGATTGINLKITDPFYNGYNTAGTTSPSGSATDFPSTATQDNFFGHALDWSPAVANPVGMIEFSGLDPHKYYSFSIFASRVSASDNRETLYTITGLNETKTAILDASNNTSNIAEILNMLPTADGKLTLKVEAGTNNTSSNKFYYIGALKIAVANTPSSVINQYADNINVYYSNSTLHINDYSGIISLYDISGKKISEGQMTFGQLNINLAKGIYIVKLSGVTQKFMVQ